MLVKVVVVVPIVPLVEMLWPVIAVGLFTALVIIAVALRMQVSPPPGTTTPGAEQAVASQPL